MVMIHEKDMTSDHGVQFSVAVSSTSSCSTFVNLRPFLVWSHRLPPAPLIISKIEALRYGKVVH